MKHAKKKGHGLRVLGMMFILLVVTTLCSACQLIKLDQLGKRVVPAKKEYAAETTVVDEKWYLILVNKWNPLPDDYQGEFVELSNGERVDARIYPQLQKMFDDMRAEGIYPIVASGYRTMEKQRQLYNDKLSEYLAQGYTLSAAEEKTQQWVSIPGTSEHQLGLGIDINADGIHSYGYEVYDWLAKNAYRYGFIYRYQENKTLITGVSKEPWHYRYVGIDAATEIQARGVCLEEYLDLLGRAD